ncbi:hypothetical protein ACQP2U_20280 [Nocardia sp. CA-084685]|uniref:hypothetical protein n=1 Tax=Nocardia sp. CA-084685 TaxID=3239970 RepID=UPI003D9703B8
MRPWSSKPCVRWTDLSCEKRIIGAGVGYPLTALLAARLSPRHHDETRRRSSGDLEPLHHRPQIPVTHRLETINNPRQLNTRAHQSGTPDS